MKKQITLVAAFSLALLASCSKEVNLDTWLKPIEFTNIEGGYKFKQPKFIRDDNGDMIFVEKLGHTAAALYDYNQDGKDDILLGEFSGKTDTFLKVYYNDGSNKKPVISSEWEYTKDKNGDELLIPGY